MYECEQTDGCMYVYLLTVTCATKLHTYEYKSQKISISMRVCSCGGISPG